MADTSVNAPERINELSDEVIHPFNATTGRKRSIREVWAKMYNLRDVAKMRKRDAAVIAAVLVSSGCATALTFPKRPTTVWGYKVTIRVAGVVGYEWAPSDATRRIIRANGCACA